MANLISPSGHPANNARIAKLELGRRLRESEETIITQKKAEISILEELYNKLKTIPFNTPKDIPQDKLVPLSRSISVIFIKLKSQLTALIKRDLEAEHKLSRLFGQTGGIQNSIQKKNTKWLNQIKTKENEILAELNEIVKYWTGVTEDKRLPRIFGAKYNSKRIVWPFEHLESEDIYLLRKVQEFEST